MSNDVRNPSRLPQPGGVRPEPAPTGQPSPPPALAPEQEKALYAYSLAIDSVVGSYGRGTDEHDDPDGSASLPEPMVEQEAAARAYADEAFDAALRLGVPESMLLEVQRDAWGERGYDASEPR